MTVSDLRQLIKQRIPDGSVLPRHTDRGHFYHIAAIDRTFPSVTGKLQILKDDSLLNFKMNRAIEYVFANYPEFTDANITEHLEKAAQASNLILHDAGDIGTRIHGYREDYFNAWITSGGRPADVRAFLPSEEKDLRALSAMRALEKFVTDRDYVPVVSELFVYDEKLELAGTLDDLGLMRRVIRRGNPNCYHDIAEEMVPALRKKFHCWKCDFVFTYEFVLLDVKTSNQFKDHYFFQVAIYYAMVCKMLGIKPTRCFILKLSKEDGTYKIEDLRELPKLVRYAKYLIKTNEALDFIRDLRKDNQKVVIKL